MRRLTAIAVAVACSVSSFASAHHSLAPFIRTRAEVVIGTVKEFTWTNPHTRLIVLVRGEDGAMVEWNFEGVSPSRLELAGFKRDTIKAGDTISVSYNPRRDKAVGGMFVGVMLASGTILKLDRYQLLRGGERVE